MFPSDRATALLLLCLLTSYETAAVVGGAPSESSSPRLTALFNVFCMIALCLQGTLLWCGAQTGSLMYAFRHCAVIWLSLVMDAVTIRIRNRTKTPCSSSAVTLNTPSVLFTSETGDSEGSRPLSSPLPAQIFPLHILIRCTHHLPLFLSPPSIFSSLHRGAVKKLQLAVSLMNSDTVLIACDNISSHW